MSGLAAQFGPGLLVAALAAPLIVLAIFLAPGLRALARAITPLAAAPALAAGALALGGAPFGAEAPALRVSLWLDRPGGLLLLAAACVWFIVSIVALKGPPVAAIADRGDAVQRASGRTPVDRRATDRVYKIGQGRPNADRFAVAWLLTMAGSLGVFIAADLLTFYLVYALVSVPAYYLVAHEEEPSSRRAGGVYMAFALIGEAVLLLAFVMLAAGEPSGGVQIRDVVAALPTSPWRDAALALIILGFGMKIALVPLHGWMPLTYNAAPIPAAAVLSGAGVKAGVIGLIRFLPLSAAFPGWGEALVWLGFITAFTGVAIGVTQRDPKTMLAYSSVSQMGVIAAAFGMALASADQGAATNVAFYAANHVLVKAALFLTVGAVAALDDRARTLALIVAALLGLSLAGLPLTGGALAKLALKDLFGAGAAGLASQLSAAATTALMLVFVMRLARLPAAERVGASPSRLWSWAALAVAALLLPWLMYPVIGGVAEAFGPAKLLDAIWPMLVGAVLAAGLWAVENRLPRIPAGDIVVAGEAAFRASMSLGPMFERADRGLREWPAAGFCLLVIALALVAAGYASR
jgi:formate hydrogenlyase subunit 3/multisubunit Na+/H+ antiporter MnhD subunit